MGDLSRYDDNTIQRFWYACQKIKPYYEKNYVPGYEVLVLKELEKRKESKM